jgi:hypothetical protein
MVKNGLRPDVARGLQSVHTVVKNNDVLCTCAGTNREFTERPEKYVVNCALLGSVTPLSLQKHYPFSLLAHLCETTIHCGELSSAADEDCGWVA